MTVSVTDGFGMQFSQTHQTFEGFDGWGGGLVRNIVFQAN